MEVCFLRGLLVVAITSLTLGDDGQVTFVSELSSKPAQKLSKYGWYGNARLQRFHIPEETAVAHWLFTVTKVNNFHCGQNNVTIHIRWGAPPVINLISSVFPNATLLSPSLSLTLPVASQSSIMFNLSDPAPGYWYIAAHLPENDGRIEQKGFPSCSYFFQPQLSIRRAVDTPILQHGTFLQQTATPERPARLKLYVPEFASSLSVSVVDCSSGEGTDCSLVFRLGSSSLQQGPVTVNCSGTGCSAVLLNPPWDSWLRVVVESSLDNQTAIFRIVSNYSVGCKPQSVGLKADDYISKLRGNSSYTNSTSAGNSSLGSDTVTLNNESASLSVPYPMSASACVWSTPVVFEEVDILSLRFTPVNGPNVSVTNTHPTLLTYPLHTEATGGTLNLQLTLNISNANLGNSSTVRACLSQRAPVFQLNQTEHCQTGYGLHVNVSVSKAVVRLPFPQSATWYLTLQLVCNSSECGNTSVVYVVPEVFVSACVEDCGTYGECRLLRSFSYLYSACVCKAGWKGWGCTDNSTAQSYRHQLTATLLLTLSNLFFLPVIVVAIKRGYFTEASVYLFTMFFSTFYHACDQPGIAVMCIMDYDALQYCDFLGSVCCVWVTILCMARFRDTFKYTLFMLGVLLIAMSLQLDRKGLWNLLGPSLCAALIMVTVWVSRGVRRRHCYPPSWQRWVLYLIPGAVCALIGICLYVFGATEDNYYYTHSLWHILMASCVVFLLPPKKKDRETLGWNRGWSWNWTWRPRVCGYTLCESGKDELYTVT